MKASMIYRFILFALFVFFFLSAAFPVDQQQSALSSSDLLKLDPRLQPLVKDKTPALLKTGDMTPGETFVQSYTLLPDSTKLYGVILQTDHPQHLTAAGISVKSVYPGFATARLSPAALIAASRVKSVRYIDAGEMYYTANDVASGNTGAALLHGGYLNNTSYTGKGVLVCIIDTGLDWEHLDFRDASDPSKSRVLFLWDQTLVKTGSEQSPQDRDGTNFAGLNEGVEYTKADIENEINGITSGFVRTADINGHGTHVAGTAAGNGASLSTFKYAGMAPEADILVVKSGNGAFATDHLIDALAWAGKMSETLNKPVVVNMSLGGHANAHDGTFYLDQAVDFLTAGGNGRAAVISAGNSGNDPIHVSGTVAGYSTAEIEMTVGSYFPSSGANNDEFGFDLWWDSGSNVIATVISPNFEVFERMSGLDGTRQTDDGTIYLYNNTDANNVNGHRRNYMRIYDGDASKPPVEGTWKLSVENNSSASMTYHGWLFTNTMSVSLAGGNTDYTVASPGTAAGAITVGSFVSRWRWSNYQGAAYSGAGTDYSDDISSFSSIGPTRDGRQKPEITAPGDKIISSTSGGMLLSPAASRIAAGEAHHTNQGTSMSAPVVTGAAALLLEADPSLSNSQIKSLFTETAMTDDYTGSGLPDYTWGYGKLDVYKAMAKALDAAAENREIFVFDGWGSSVINHNVEDYYISTGFMPSFSSQSAGVFFHTGQGSVLSGYLHFEIWSDNSGLPGSKLGSTVTFDTDAVMGYSWNYADLTSSGVMLNAGTNYHLVMYSQPGNSFVMLDEWLSAGGRSGLSIDNGQNWLSWSDNWRIRPVAVSAGLIQLSANVFLEGAYSAGAGEMTTYLNTAGHIPLTSPYADARTVSSVPADVTDWICVELRETADGAAIVSKSAFLHKDGRIVADDGTSHTVELAASPGSYYVVIRHRNHLAVMSAAPVDFTGVSGSLDFTSGNGTQLHGSGGVELASGIWGMWTGDTDGSGTVDANDRSATWNNRNQTGYLDSDCHLSGTVDANDRSVTWNNRNRTSSVP